MTRSAPTDGRSERAATVRAERRAEILAAAVRVFATKGYHSASITDIVDAAGVARGTFYLYFESKNQIFHALLDELLDELRSNVVGVRVAPDAPPPLDQLVASVRRVIEVAIRRRDLARIVFRSAIGLDAEVDAKLDGFYRRIQAFGVDALLNGEALGVVRPAADDDERKTIALAMLGSIRQVMEHALAGEVTDPEATARALVGHHARGLWRFS